MTNSASNKIALIYNPHAGQKRGWFSFKKKQLTALEDIKELLDQYQIIVDFMPTKSAGHATILAKECVKNNYQLVIAAGGDGTVGETANGLIGSETTLGVLPIGSFMNIARMLSIPNDLEKAVALIKIGRSRKIDVGKVDVLDGQELKTPQYFIESVGLGLEAQLHHHVLEFERGDLTAPFHFLKTLFNFYGYKSLLKIDSQIVNTYATLVAISNGPYTGAAIPLAPDAKLNDHRLTVSLFRMSKTELIRYIIKIINEGKIKSGNRKVTTYQAKTVTVDSKFKRMVHADARIYGYTPAEFSILPSALNVITGFPKKDEPTKSLLKRNYLDP